MIYHSTQITVIKTPENILMQLFSCLYKLNHKKTNRFTSISKENTPGAIRTHNQQLRRLVLCPLSYGGKAGDYTIKKADQTGRIPL